VNGGFAGSSNGVNLGRAMPGGDDWVPSADSFGETVSRR
jgi:hypothetical protein